jgi:hypothetical protein
MDLTTGEVTAIVGVASVIVGTIGGKYLDRLSKRDDMSKEELLALREDIDDADIHLDNWKLKYFDLREQNLDLQANIDALEIEIAKLKLHQ